MYMPDGIPGEVDAKRLDIREVTGEMPTRKRREGAGWLEICPDT